RVLQNAVCTAYSFKPGTFGASGMHMFQGFVAVNTNVIPYGSLLYITSPTGKFTYGWAIAADVGEAMMAGYVDIDLFFETYTESALFGKHKMNVYVVKQLNQPELEQYAAHPGMFRSRVPS
ncbi:MAG: 3D domain-containing protein, partial [Oscillospiraceae bacterium]